MTNEVPSKPMNMELCHDCGAKPGEFHHDGCDTERCPACGGQLLSCGCSDAEINEYPRQPWTGEWPGVLECQEFGWYAKLIKGQGWVPCDKNDEGASENLNRLYSDAEWNAKLGRFVIKKINENTPDRTGSKPRKTADKTKSATYCRVSQG